MKKKRILVVRFYKRRSGTGRDPGFAIVLALAAWAQSVTVSVPVGNGPAALAIDAVTNKIYVANSNASTVTVISSIRFLCMAPIDAEES